MYLEQIHIYLLSIDLLSYQIFLPPWDPSTRWTKAHESITGFKPTIIPFTTWYCIESPDLAFLILLTIKLTACNIWIFCKDQKLFVLKIKTILSKAIKTEVGTKLHNFPFLDTLHKDKNWILLGWPQEKPKICKNGRTKPCCAYPI